MGLIVYPVYILIILLSSVMQHDKKLKFTMQVEEVQENPTVFIFIIQ